MAHAKNEEIDYFSALKPSGTASHPSDAPSWEPEWKYELGESMAFVHNLEYGIPEAMRKADVLYSDPPWQAGYKTFYASANLIPKQSWAEFAVLLNSEIERLNKPTIITCGKPMLRYLKPDSVHKGILNGAKVNLALWNIEKTWAEDEIDATALLHHLANRYDVIGDFAGGYGRTAKIFSQYGKNWILSDLNPSCIGFIKHNATKWTQ